MIDEHQAAGATMAYETWFALKEYFKDDSKYDYFKFKGKILRKTVKEKFATSKYIHSAIGLYNKYKSREEIEKAVIANLLADPGAYISNIDFEAYRDLIKRYESILYIFEQDLKKIFGSNAFPTIEEYFLHSESYPYSYIFDLYTNKEICIETLIVLDSITKFLQKIEKDHTDFIFQEDYERIKKYKKFFIQWQKYYIIDYKKILKKVLLNLHHA